MNIKQTCIILYLLCGSNLLFCQSYSMKIPITEKEKTALLEVENELFGLTPNLTFNISLTDPLQSLSELSDQVKYDDKYYNQLKEKFEKDSLNPFVNNDLANYFTFYQQTEYAHYFFTRAYSHLTLEHFNNDSSNYLSYRGILKLNLGMDHSIEDMERALLLDPNDSTAMIFYPVFLVNQGEYVKLREFCMKALDQNPSNPLLPYIFLIMGDISNSIFAKVNECSSNEKLKSGFAKTDYDKLIDFSRIDSYARKFQDNKSIQNARFMADLLALTFKIVFFEKSADDKPILVYTSAERKKLNKLKEMLVDPKMKNELNEYSINKALGFTNLLLKDNELSLFHFNEAIRLFPARLKSGTFNPMDSYNGLLCIYFLLKDDINLTKTLERMIADEPEGRPNQKNYSLLAGQYYLMGDLKNAELWANKSSSINPKDVETLRLFAHLNYLNGNTELTQTQLQDAYSNSLSSDDQYNVILQFSIYNLIDGDATNAYINIENARKSLNGESCERCDRLIQKYILIKKE